MVFESMLAIWPPSATTDTERATSCGDLTSLLRRSRRRRPLLQPDTTSWDGVVY